LAFTFFFRDQHVLERAVEHCLPAMTGRNHPRVWDAGVAMGQESYTLAILFAERMGHFSFNNLRIEATDVENTNEVAEVIKAGVYGEDDLSRLPHGIVEKYFERQDKPGHLRVIDRLRQRVVFQPHDLLSLREPGQGYVLVVCKNVLLHFKARQRIEVLRMFHRALETGGFLVTEQTQEMPAEASELFERVIPDGQLFRKVDTWPHAA
jgi:chemotaxis protein methyltransferase CheR